MPWLLWMSKVTLCVVNAKQGATLSDRVDLTYQPVPQSALLRPRMPSAEQHAPQVGLQTVPAAGPHVPSNVTVPVCHGDKLTVVRLCHETWRQERIGTREEASS